MLILFNPDSNEPVLPGTLPIFGLVSLLQLYFIYTFSICKNTKNRGGGRE
jgi:hypothetical protein